MMQPVDAIKFVDADSGGEAVVTVRAGEEGVALAVYLVRDGDIMVVMSATECNALAAALQRAAAIARPSGDGQQRTKQ